MVAARTIAAGTTERAKIAYVHPYPEVVVGCERTGDTLEQSTIRSINEIAFGRPDEANLVESLRREDAVLLSLVAEVEQRIAGHI